MAVSRALTPRMRSLGTLLVVAAIATALGGVAPAAAGGKPMPLAPPQRSAAAANQRVTEVLKANPGSRRISATSVLLAPGVVMTVPGPVAAGATMSVPVPRGRQVTVAAADTSCASGWLCMWQHVYRGGAKLAFYYCNTQNLGNYYISAGNSWRDDISSIWNHQTGGVVSDFYDWKLVSYRLVGSLSAHCAVPECATRPRTDRGCYRRAMPDGRVVSGAVAAGLVAAGTAATAQATVKHSRVAAEVQRRLADTTYQRLGDIGTVDTLSVLPLVDRGVQRRGLRGEPGVSYLVRAGGEMLLFDTGLNLFRRSRSALVDNAETLGVDLAQVPAVVLSHQHEDHVGGVRAQRAGTFAFSGDPVEPPGLVAYAPVPLTHPSAEVRVTTRATLLAPGMALLPPLPAALFWDDSPVLEQALVVNVRGVGLVLISGCGHPGAEAMLNLVQEVLEVPLHGVIGGLHLPVQPWPRHLPQALTGSPRPPWRPLSDLDIDGAVTRLRAAGAWLVAVSGHDSTPHTMRRFAAAFGPGFREVTVGDEIHVQGGS